MVDISADNIEEQVSVVDETLAEIKAGDKPVIMAFNKVDRLQERDKQHLIGELRTKYQNPVFISASKGINLNALYDRIYSIINENLVEAEVTIPVSDNEAYRTISRLHEQVEILETQYLAKKVTLRIRAFRP